MVEISADRSLSWLDVAAVADGARLSVSEDVGRKIFDARVLVERVIESGLRTYGLNTGVGAFHNVLIDRDRQKEMSRNIVMSHSVGVGDPLGVAETRAIIAAQINNFAHGYSGVRLEVVDQLLWLLDSGCTPLVPTRGSIGYITHAAHIALVLIGAGHARVRGEVLPGAEALKALGRSPIVLEAKEGLSLVNGSPCATGLACVALARGTQLLDACERIAAVSFEALRGQVVHFSADAIALHRSPGLNAVAARMRARLEGSARLAQAAGLRTQDALALRAIPQVHGGAWDATGYVAEVVGRELQSVTDNPVVFGSPSAPTVRMQANAVAAGVGLAMDVFGVAIAEVAAMAERRLDRLINPLVSGLPPFLAQSQGLHSGMMIAQYTANALVADNRRLASPASLDNGVSAGLQEDHLAHATGASLKALRIVENFAEIVGIELVCAAQAAQSFPASDRAPASGRLLDAFRARVPAYADDRPLSDDFRLATEFCRGLEPRTMR